MDRRSIIAILVIAVSFFLIQEWLFPSKEPIKREVIEEKKALVKRDGDLYVLENSYQQIVFSSKGGSIAEINLPFKSDKDPKSVVNKIGVDRLLEKEKLANFPLFPYHVSEKAELQPPTSGDYYPLLRRDVPSKYYALNMLSEDLENAVYKLKRFEKELIEFEAETPFRKVTKTFFWNRDSSPYSINLDIKIEGNSKNLQLTCGIPEVELIMDSSTFEFKYGAIRGQKEIVENIDLPKNYIESSSTTFNWIGYSNGFFGSILQPKKEMEGYRINFIKGDEVPTRLSLINPTYKPYPADKFPGYELLLPTTKSVHSFSLFFGPLDSKIIGEFSLANAKGEYKPDYIDLKKTSGFLSTISTPFAKVLFWMLKGFYFVTKSWGLSILLITLVLRLVLYPSWVIRAQQRMQTVAPQVKAIQERYKKDPKRAQMEVMKFYKENGGNPLISGCLPTLIQLPILIGLFTMLRSSFELRGVPFIPGWIDNLAAPDVLFSWNYPLFVIGTNFHLLPFLLGLSTFIQQRFFSSYPKDTKQLTDQQRQQIVMGNVMGVVLIFIFYNLPSGLNIYYLFSTVLGIGQQWLVTKKAKT